MIINGSIVTDEAIRIIKERAVSEYQDSIREYFKNIIDDKKGVFVKYSDRDVLTYNKDIMIIGDNIKNASV